VSRPEVAAAKRDAYTGSRPEVVACVPAWVGTVLDVGCSSGALGAALKRRGHTVVGIEVDAALAAEASAALDAVVVADVVGLVERGERIDGGPFDCVVLADVLEHLPDPWSALRWVEEQLTPDGVVVVSLPNVRHLETFWSLLVRKTWPYKDFGLFDRTHLRWFARGNLGALFAPAGLTITQVRRVPILSLDPSSPLNRLAPLLGDLGALQLLIVAERTQPAPPLDGDSVPAPTGAQNPFEAHGAQVSAVLPEGDPSAIKGLYGAFGQMLESAYGDDPGTVPVLSFPETGPVVAEMLAGAPGPFLDAGCGPNPSLSLRVAASAPGPFVAMDIGLGTVRLARAVGVSQGRDLLAIVGDLEHLPFRADAFASGVCDDTIEHVPDDRAAMAELERVLRPGGRLVIATPNRIRLDVLEARARDLLRGRRAPAQRYFAAESHLREYTWRDLESLVDGRLRISRRASVGWTGGRLARAATALVSLPALRAGSRMVVLEVTKV
jgi:2-polyprenyl-3-methyl-5-hydroxy-6-metoxy-1,4-benzoquinol methylase